MRVKGAGNKNADIPGDLLVTLNPKTSRYALSGDDIVTKVKIDCFEAMIGCKRNIKTLDGEKKIAIPAGIQPNKKIRLSNLGFPSSLHSRVRGNFLVEVEIFVPKITDGDTINLLNKMRGE